MSMYETGTISATLNATAVTGTGTAWSDRKFGISPQCTLAVYGTGTIDLYAISRVDSDTQLTVTRPVTVAFTGRRYGILVAETQSLQYWVNMLTANLAYQQGLLDNLQTVMTGTGSVTVTAPDGQQVTISSFKKLTDDMTGLSDDITGLSNDITGLNDDITGLNNDINTVTSAGWGASGTIIDTKQYPTLGDIHISSIFQASAQFPDFPTRGLPGFDLLNDQATIITCPYTPTKKYATQLAQVWQGAYRDTLFIRSNNGTTWGAWGRINTVLSMTASTGRDIFNTQGRDWNSSFIPESPQYGGNAIRFRQFDDGNGAGGNSPMTALGNKIAGYGVAQFIGTGAFSAQQVITERGVGIRTLYTSDTTKWTSWYYMLSSRNTTTDANGFIKAASPVVKLFSDGSCELNDESAGVTTEQLATGQYRISGCLGLNADAAWGGVDGGFSIPLDRNNQPLIWLDYKVTPDGSVIIKTYHRTHPAAPAFAQNNIDGLNEGDPVNIPDDQFVSVRVQMPQDSIWNQKNAESEPPPGG